MHARISMRFKWTSVTRFLLSLPLLWDDVKDNIVRVVQGYRIAGSANEGQPFGLLDGHGGDTDANTDAIGQSWDPSSTLDPVSVNPGSQESLTTSFPEYPMSKNRIMACPQIVGPILMENNNPTGDGEETYHYYCRDKLYGYCDVRSGTCYCNDGYQGSSCEDCEPTHVKLGELCYPKRLCPNDCSNAGTCNVLTGICHCFEFRDGMDCSIDSYHQFDEQCTSCNSTQCLGCRPGYSISLATSSNGNAQCQPCHRFDPRCAECNTTQCLGCADLLLSSIARVGARANDPQLPLDELKRQLSFSWSVGTTDPRYFDQAEVYEVITDPSIIPLYDHAVSCHVGNLYNHDNNETPCTPAETSHKVCGHSGVLEFDAPVYTVHEDAGYVRVTIRRSGGGYGTVEVGLQLNHLTTDDAYVMPIIERKFRFTPGQIQTSFDIPIHDNRSYTIDGSDNFNKKTFELVLLPPSTSSSDGATLGVQHCATVHIVDDDRHKVCPRTSHLVVASSSENISDMSFLTAIAGEGLSIPIQARTCANQSIIPIPIVSPGDAYDDIIHFRAELEAEDGALIVVGSSSQYESGASDDDDGRTHTIFLNSTKADTSYDLNIYQLTQGGLRGSYFRTSISFAPEYMVMLRIDPTLNFYWNQGPITPLSRDSVSIQWEGYVRADFTETYTFHVEFDDYVRVWLDGELVINDWSSSSPPTLGSAASATCNVDMDANTFQFIRIQYREHFDDAKLILEWESANNTPRQVIPKQNLFYKESIQGSPFPFTVLPSTTISALTSNVIGLGFGAEHEEEAVDGISGVPYMFTLEPRDTFGNLVRSYDSHAIPTTSYFTCVATLFDVNDEYADLPVQLTFNRLAQNYDGSFTPIKSGSYDVNLWLHHSDGDDEETDQPAPMLVAGSPFEVTVRPGSTDPAASILVESDVFSSTQITAGEQMTFRIQNRDSNYNNYAGGGDPWDVRVVHSLSGTGVFGSAVTDINNGQYELSFVPIRAGANKVHVAIHGMHMVGSPFPIMVEHNVAVGATSYPLLTDLTSQTFRASHSNTVLVQMVDAWDNLLTTAGDPLFVTSIISELRSNFSAEGGEHVDAGVAIHVGDGVFRIDITPTRSGYTSSELYIIVNGEHLRGSPFKVTVIAGDTQAIQSTAFGRGLVGAVAMASASFIVETRDANGNPRLLNDSNVTAQLQFIGVPWVPAGLELLEGEDIEMQGVVVDVNYVGQGQYELSYVASIAGRYTLTVYANDNTIITNDVSSPAIVDVAPGPPFAPHCLLVVDEDENNDNGVAGEPTSDTIHLYARDVSRNFVRTASSSSNNEAATFRGQLRLQQQHRQSWEPSLEGDYFQHLDFHDDVSNAGRYEASYTVAFAGRYDLTVVMQEAGLFGPWGVVYNSPDFDPAHVIRVVEGFDLTHVWDEENNGDEDDGRVLNCHNGSFAFLGHTLDHNSLVELCDSGDPPQVYSDGLSAVWGGFLLGLHTEEHTFRIECNGGEEQDSTTALANVSLRVGDMAVVEWGDCSLLPERVGRFHLTADALTPFQLHIGQNVGIPRVKLWWSSATIISSAWQEVPLEQFYREVHVEKRQTTVAPNDWMASRSTATGESLIRSNVGLTHRFLIELRDGYGTSSDINPTASRGGSWGNLLTSSCGVTCVVEARAEMVLLLDSSDGVIELLDGSVTDNLNGTYTVQYTPIVSAPYLLNVTVSHASAPQQQHILGSPFDLMVYPGHMHAPTSGLLLWNGDAGAIVNGVAGSQTEFTIVLRDSLGNQLTAAGGHGYFLEVTVGMLDGTIRTATVRDNNNGMYTASIQIFQSGTFPLDIRISLDATSPGVPLGGSPYDLAIKASQASPKTTHLASGESYRSTPSGVYHDTNWAFQTTASHTRLFRIQLRDKYENNVLTLVEEDQTASALYGHITGISGDNDSNGEDGGTAISVGFQPAATGNGQHTGNCRIDVPGLYNMAIYLAPSSAQGFLREELFATPNLSGAPMVSQETHRLEFDFRHDDINGSTSNIGIILDETLSSQSKSITFFASARWAGYVKCPLSEPFYFHVETGHAFTMLWIDNELQSSDPSDKKVYCLEGNLHVIRLEVTNVHSKSFMALAWSSRNTPQQPIPPASLYHTAEPIHGSPFDVTVLESS